MSSTTNGRYIMTYIALVVAGLALAGGIRYYAGPEYLACEHYEEGIAEILLSGKNVVHGPSGDQGLVLKRYVGKLGDRKDVLVLGSSRCQMIGSDLFPGRSFFNSYVAGAYLGDVLAAYEMYENRGLLPSVVVLGLDPWMLAGEADPVFWPSLRQEYLSMSRRLGISPDVPANILNKEDLLALFSLTNLEHDLGRLFPILMGGIPYYSTDSYADDAYSRMRDGSVVWPLLDRTRSAEDVEDLVMASALVTSLRQGEWYGADHLDEAATESLEAFVDYLQRENVQVVFYLAPYHPEAWDLLKWQSVYPGAEEYLRDLACDKGIAVVGSYDPEESGATMEDFYDEAHSKERFAERAFSALSLQQAQNET